ncbi:MAG: phage major capsid protein [Bacteroidetes bacterium]|nr:phage major capsid protein [Bacteroidota bacterium]
MKLIKRELQIESKMDEDYILDFSVASDAPISMSFGVEVLTMDTVSVQLERLRTAGNIVFNHDADEVVGKILDAYIEDGKLRVKAKFSQNSEYFPMIADGTLTSVSLGYIVHKYEDRDGILYAKSWTPYEVSIVSIPADITVGIGRSMEVEKKEQKITKIEIIKEELKMENINYRDLGKQYGLNESDINFAERSNLSTEQFQNLVIERLQSKPVNTKNFEPELSAKEIRTYDISKAILSKVKGQLVDAGFELEVSREIEKLTGRTTSGIFIPAQVLANRNMTVGGGHVGADFVATVNANEYLGYAFNQTLGAQIGVRYLPGLTSNLTVPKVTSAAAFSWVGETGEIALSNVSGSQVTLSPKRGGSSTSYSLQLLKQSTPTLNQWLMENINSAVAVGMDNAIFNGSGNSNQPTGVLNAGITSISGSSFSYATALSFPSTVAVANRLGGNLYFVANPTTAATLKARAKETGYPTYVLSEDGMMAGYKVFESNQIGSSTVIFGDFSKVLVGQFGGVEMVIDEYTQARSGLVVLTTQVLMDVATLDTNAFAKSTTVS